MKPDNFVMGVRDNSDTIYVVDFGLSKSYLDLATGKHIEFRANKKLTGIARYASISTHLGYEQSRRDDLESLGYSLVYLLSGMLPWQRVRGPNRNDTREKILKLKINTPIHKLRQGLPEAFSKFLYYCRRLEFEATPDYEYLRSLFRNYFCEQNYNKNIKLEWYNIELNVSKDQRRAVSFDYLAKIADQNDDQCAKEVSVIKKSSCNVLRNVNLKEDNKYKKKI